MIVFGACLASLAATALPAQAHEITLALAIAAPDDTSNGDDADLRDGLRLAIDQSPDVGHAPGEDAGDHLGGVDVDLVTLDRADSSSAGAAADAALAVDATVLIAVGTDDLLSELATRLADAPLLLIGVPRSPDPAQAPPGGMLVMRQATEADGSRAEAVAADFVTRFGREPSVWGLVGHDLGLVLDELLTDTGAAIPDVAAVEAASTRIAARTTASSLEFVAAASEPAPTPTGGNATETASSPPNALPTDAGTVRSAVVPWVAVTVTVLLVIGAGALRVRRGGRRPS